jgi:protein ImuB
VDGRAADGGAADEGIEAGGITLLRLIPDQLVRDEGRQLGLWGDAVISDRVARRRPGAGHARARRGDPPGTRSLRRWL